MMTIDTISPPAVAAESTTTPRSRDNEEETKTNYECFDGDSNNNNDDNDRKHVTFHEIQIYEFPVIIGDNPAISCGPSLNIGWYCYSTKTMKLDIYESTRIARRKTTKSELVISETKRIKRLKGAGFTDNQIDRATELANKIRKSRRDNSTPSALSIIFGGSKISSFWNGKTMKKIRNNVD